MSEQTETIKTETSAPQAAAPAKPKRPKPKSMIMLGEQTAALFENARLAKERGEKVGLVCINLPAGDPQRRSVSMFSIRRITLQASLPDIRLIRFCRNAKVLLAIPMISAHTQR